MTQKSYPLYSPRKTFSARKFNHKSRAGSYCASDQVSTNIIDVLRERELVDACTNESMLIEAAKTPMKVYCGFDPTADSLHLGNLLGIVVLSWFQRCGHTPVILLGGATGSIGDPSGKSLERPLLSREVIDANADNIGTDLNSILARDNLRYSRPQVMNNLDWFASISFLDFLRDVGRHARVGTMLSRDSVKSRLESESGLSFTEFSYQLLQGYDFVHLFREHNVTVQVGGSDQWGNIVAGTDLIRRIISKEVAYGVTFPLLLKSDGKKFGKSEDGAIWLSSKRLSPFKFYQYLLRTSDEDVIRLMKMLTFLPISDIEEIEKAMGKEGYVPNTAQVRLAEEITKFVHGETGLEEAKAATKGLLPGSDTKLDIDTLESLVDIVPTSEITREEAFTLTVVDILVKVGLQGSKGEARRMIKGGGVRINNIKVADEAAQLKPSDLISGRMLLLSAGKKNKFLLQVKE